MDCIFCRIISGQLPSSLIAENDHAVAFNDINPLAPVHILVAPKKHTQNITELTDAAELDGLMQLVRQVSAAETNGAFRLQFNTGAEAGQSVFHTHAHILSSAKA